MPTLVHDGILGVFILEDQQVDLHMASRFPVGPLAMAWMPRTSQSLTLMTLVRKLMLNFGHFRIHNLVRVKVTEVGPPITPVAPGLDLSLAVVPNLVPGILVDSQVWAPPIIQQLLGGLLVMETSLDCEIEQC